MTGKEGNTMKTWGIAGAVVFVLLIAGCGTMTATDNEPLSPASTQQESTPAPTPTSTVDEAVITDPSFYSVKLKTTSKQCYGSAGCLVDVKADVAVLDTSVLPDEGTIDLTFKISGDESGPVIETTTLYMDEGNFDVVESNLTTSSTYVKPKAKVVSVEYNEESW